MSVLDYFKPVSSWTPEQVKDFIRERDDDAYTLLDVRQPKEYEKGHLPGAVLIPVGELDERVSELDPAKPTIVYCASGVRSRAAASILVKAGFGEVYCMAGGLNAWSGAVAEGSPEAGISWFSVAHSVEELAALAWVLEDGSELFYREMTEVIADPEAASIFAQLSKAEERHKSTVSGLFPLADFRALLNGYPKEKLMEGGMRVGEAFSWADGRTVGEVLDLCIALETSSYDRYQTLQRRVTLPQSVELFRTLAAEEKRHLRMLAGLLEDRI